MSHTRAITCVSVIVGALSSNAMVSASPHSRALTRDGYSLAYDLRFSESLNVFASARAADPSDPAPVRAAAAVTWMELLFAQGAATFAAFEGDASSDEISRPVVPPELEERFLTHVQTAIQLAEHQLSNRPHDGDAQYQVAASSALLALYRGTVEGRTLAAFTEGRKAVRIMGRIRERDAGHREAALVPGIYRYAVSTLSWPKRTLAAAFGMAGDRDGGIALLETAAADLAETASDASLVLMVVYNREGRHMDALRHLRQLRLRHPRNRLLRLNLAATALAGSEAALAEREVTEAFADGIAFSEPAALGERGLWFYTRGVARVLLGRNDALADMRESVRANPRDWVRARAHVELGRIAVQSGKPEEARVQFAAALHYAKECGDKALADMAKRLHRSLGREAVRTRQGPHHGGPCCIPDGRSSDRQSID